MIEELLKGLFKHVYSLEVILAIYPINWPSQRKNLPEGSVDSTKTYKVSVIGQENILPVINILESFNLKWDMIIDESIIEFYAMEKGKEDD